MSSTPRAIVLVRHGESEHHIRRLTGGWTDTSLTPTGREQARRVAERLRTELAERNIRLFSSDLKRSSETAAFIGELLGLEPLLDLRLREHNNGEAVGLSLEDAQARFPQPWPWKIDQRPYPGAETWREFYERSTSFLEELADDGSLPIIVSHGGTIQNLVAWWLRIDADGVESVGFEARPTAITVLRVRDGLRNVERLNDVGHLDGTAGSVSLRDVLRAE